MSAPRSTWRWPKPWQCANRTSPNSALLLEAALAIDPDKVPTLRLANTLARRRAQWLMLRIPDLFIEADQPKEKSQ